MPLPAWPPAWGARAGDPGLCTDAFSGYLWQGRGSLVLGRLRSRPRGSLRTPQGLERLSAQEKLVEGVVLSGEHVAPPAGVAL